MPASPEQPIPLGYPTTQPRPARRVYYARRALLLRAIAVDNAAKETMTVERAAATQELGVLASLALTGAVRRDHDATFCGVPACRSGSAAAPRASPTRVPPPS